MPASTVRLVMAAAVLTDSWITWTDLPGEIGAEFPVWDELIKVRRRLRAGSPGPFRRRAGWRGRHRLVWLRAASWSPAAPACRCRW